MSDLLLGAINPQTLIQQDPTKGQDPLTQLANILANPDIIFTKIAEEMGSPFSPSGDFRNGQSSSSVNLFNEEAAASEPEAKPEFPLPEEGVPKGDEPIDDKYKNADGTTKSAEQIIKDSPAAANFCKDKGDAKEIYENAKKNFGDWENEKDPEKAARSAIKFRQLAEFADNASSKDGADRGEEAGNGNINGFTSSMEVRNGTEGAIMADYFRKGRQFVVDEHGDGINKEGHLGKTNDRYVRADGSTRSDVGQVFVDIGKGISHVIPGLGNVISGAADGIDRGAQKGDFGAAIIGGFKGGASAAAYTASNALDMLDPTDPQGMVNGARNLFNGSYTETL